MLSCLQRAEVHSVLAFTRNDFGVFLGNALNFNQSESIAVFAWYFISRLTAVTSR